MSVGDVNSMEQGSGARFNDGKAPMQYVYLNALLEAPNASGHFDDRSMNVLCRVADYEARECPAHQMTEELTSADFRKAADVLEYGAKKYAAHNWAKGQPMSVALASLKRHVLAMMDGEVLDSESQCEHWGHIVCNIIFVHHFDSYHPNMDDRPPPVCFGRDESVTKDSLLNVLRGLE